MSFLESLSITEIAPVTSPSVIKFILTFIFFKLSIIFLCLGRSNTQAVNLSGVEFFASANNDMFFSTELSKSNKFFGKFDPMAIFSI